MWSSVIQQTQQYKSKPIFKKKTYDKLHRQQNGVFDCSVEEENEEDWSMNGLCKVYDVQLESKLLHPYTALF